MIPLDILGIGGKMLLRSSLLVILNPRIIPEVIDSIETTPIQKVWISGYNEEEACKEINLIVNSTLFDYYIIHSDDCIINKSTLLDIVSYQEAFPNDIFSGYCRLAKSSNLINISRKPLTFTGPGFTWDDYEFYALSNLKNKSMFVGYYAGFSLTSLKRDYLLEIPIQTVNGYQSDAAWFYKAKKRVYSNTAWYLEHLKEDVNNAFVAPKAPRGITWT